MFNGTVQLELNENAVNVVYAWLKHGHVKVEI